MADALNGERVFAALRATGERLHLQGFAQPVRLILAGGTAGLLAGELKPPRTTHDCDVLWPNGEDEKWRNIERAGEAVQHEMDLPARWLNRDCHIHAWCLMLGWEDRCEPVGRFGPLEVLRLSRIDLVAAKVVSSPNRPQDLEDVRFMRPTREELWVVEGHLGRLEAEDLDAATYTKQWAIVTLLRSEIGDSKSRTS